MPVRAKTITVAGSGDRTTLTDLQPGRQRTTLNPLTERTLVSWLLPAAVGLVAGAIWGKNSAPNEDLIAAQTDRLEAAITKDEAMADEATARAEGIRAAIEDPQGLSRPVAEDLAKRRLGLEERNADRVQDAYEDERNFRRNQREAQGFISNAKIRLAQAEADTAEARSEELFQRSLTAGERARLETDKLSLTNQRDAEQLQLIRTLRETLQQRGRLLPEMQLPVIRRIGPGLGPVPIELGRFSGVG